MRRLSLTRRRFLKGSAAFTVTSPFIVTHAYAEWPDRPIRLSSSHSVQAGRSM